MSLRMVAQLVIHEMPSYSKQKQPPKLFLPNDILLKTFYFKAWTAVYVSSNNPGAMEMADELHEKYGTPMLTISRQMPPEFAAYDINNIQSEDDEGRSSHYSTSTSPSTVCSTCTHMLLYLCKETFVGDAGQRLAHEIREANRLSLHIVMVHECDPDKNGCPFAQFFRTTPDDLISSGLYGAIAVSHTSLKPQTSRPRADVLLTRLGLALDRTPSTRSRTARSAWRPWPRLLAPSSPTASFGIRIASQAF